MKTLLIPAFIFLTIPVFSQKSNAIGAELDALPYVTDGYYFSLWFGHGHMRYRPIVTKVTTPGLMVADGFTNNEIKVYAAIADYFFKPGFEKWWVGAGLEYWDGSIQTDDKLFTATYGNTMLTAGGGYVWKFYRNFYLNPWAALHARVAGDGRVTTGDGEFSPPCIVPEVSIKIGWYLNIP